MAQPIRGKVAEILNSKELVMNIGTANGVNVGMYFDIVETTEVKDPDTSKVLGKVERPKVTLRVIEVQENLTVASTLNKIFVSDDNSFSSSLLSSKGVIIKVGDTVVESEGITF